MTQCPLHVLDEPGLIPSTVYYTSVTTDRQGCHHLFTQRSSLFLFCGTDAILKSISQCLPSRIFWRKMAPILMQRQRQVFWHLNGLPFRRQTTILLCSPAIHCISRRLTQKEIHKQPSWMHWISQPSIPLRITFIFQSCSVHHGHPYHPSLHQFSELSIWD